MRKLGRHTKHAAEKFYSWDAFMERTQIAKVCPFCRTPAQFSDGEYIERIKTRVEADDAGAICQLVCFYSHGRGVPQDSVKAVKLYLKAGKLGCAGA